MDVTATIIPRREIERIGIAPLTSMFQAGEGDLSQRTDFRPEIHDPDGLMMQSGGGEWIWRPIRNPKALRISSFGDKNPRGFGLMQRDRDFGSYQDLEARYQQAGLLGRAAGRLGRRPDRPHRNPHGERGLGQHRRLLDAQQALAERRTNGVPLPHLGDIDDLQLHPYAQVQQTFNGSDIEDGVVDGTWHEALHRRLCRWRPRLLPERARSPGARRDHHGRDDHRPGS